MATSEAVAFLKGDFSAGWSSPCWALEKQFWGDAVEAGYGDSEQTLSAGAVGGSWEGLMEEAASKLEHL